ncbi:MAG TPA: hypothetical protein VGK29_09760 [Paludibaculum sp.]
MPVLLRMALLPIAPPPEPCAHDEFSYLLGADTFAHGRLTNPPHPLWVHLEAFHVNPIPTYASKYPPAQSMFLAVGHVAFGHPWAGVLLGYAFMCAALCWALQQWGPPWAALLVTILAGMHMGFGFAVHSVSAHWLNTYWGGAVACAGGAFLIGALPGLTRTASRGTILVAVAGVLILLNSRPFEGTVLIAVCLLALVFWRRGMRRTGLSAWRFSNLAPAILLLASGGCWMAYYNLRVTGDPMQLPYLVNQRMYARASAFWLAPELPAVSYRHEDIRKLYIDWDLPVYKSVRSNPWIMVKQGLSFAIPFLFSTFWLPGLLALLLVWPSPKLRVVLAALLGFTVLAILPMKYVQTHYFAPMIPLVLIATMQGFRLVRAAAWRRRETWRRAFLGWVSVCAFMALVSAAAWGWYSGKPPAFARARLDTVARLERSGSRHVVIVRRSKSANILEDWINNEADIDRSRIVWARDMGVVRNQELLLYYGDRQKWLLEPDQSPLRLVPYPE